MILKDLTNPGQRLCHRAVNNKRNKAVAVAFSLALMSHAVLNLRRERMVRMYRQTISC
jgi:hypothetical protein